MIYSTIILVYDTIDSPSMTVSMVTGQFIMLLQKQYVIHHIT